MFQAICKLMLIVPLLFAGALLAVHAQPVHDDVRQFLAQAQACAIPCWQGIQPGVTTTDQANDLLSANPWIAAVQVIDHPPSTYLYWQWSDQKPAFAGDPHLLIPPLMWAEHGVIQMIYIPTALSYGDVSLLLGAPMLGSFEMDSFPNSVALANRPSARHVAAYFGGQVNFDVQVICPISLDRFWSAPVTITYVSTTLTRLQPRHRNDDLPHWLYGQPYVS
jgi:hypothetical protein